MKIKKALVVAPHPDDEINLAAQLIIELQKQFIDIYILYTTNGDAETKIGNKRIQEAINALSLLDIPEENIIFLGYANEWKQGRHIFESIQVISSKLGKTKTNSLKTHPEYCYSKYGVHHEFTYINFKKDFKDVIEELLPDLLVCVDFDKHPDHRAASLTFDKVIGELLKEKKGYYPLVLKKFAYNGVWFGEKDYYSIPFQPTVKSPNFIYSGMEHELESPAYTWKERLSFNVDCNTTTTLLKNNLLYKMAKRHVSTIAWYQMQRVINADMVYWYRPTMNLAIHAKIIASSGDVSYLNDFVLYGYKSILSENEPFENASNLWQPDEGDNRKEIRISFHSERKIRYINIYEDCNKQNHIRKLKIRLGDNSEYEIECNSNGTLTQIDLGVSKVVSVIRLSIEEYIGQPGIAEIEIIPEEAMNVNWPLTLYTGCSSDRKKISIRMWIEKILMDIHFLFAFKIGYEIRQRRHK